MKECLIQDRSFKGGKELDFQMEQCESVEFSLQGLHCLHHFRIWNIVPDAMCVLVREGSEILGALSEGDVLPLKYYTSSLLCPIICLDTEIRHIKKEEEGRFRGHYVIGLQILEQGCGQKPH